MHQVSHAKKVTSEPCLIFLVGEIDGDIDLYLGDHWSVTCLEPVQLTEVLLIKEADKIQVCKTSKSTFLPPQLYF